MKHISKLFLLSMAAALLFMGCDKVGNLPSYKNGIAPVLSSSTNSVAAAPADSLNNVLTLLWTSPKYETNLLTVKYVVEIDTAGGNFAKASSKTISGDYGISYTAKELNNILLGYGFAFGEPHDMIIRVTSSYANNNEPYTSNTITVQMTAYKIPPKIALPTSGKLFIVGDATDGGWNNPVPVPVQELVQIDETTYGGVFHLNGGKEYLILPVNGDWGHKFSVANKGLEGLSAGGDFGYDFSDNFPAPATSGTYAITLDFQKGKFTVVPYTGFLPTNLFIVGNATEGGWNNPVPTPSQQFNRINSSVFELTLPLVGAGEYLMLPVNGDWGNKFSVSNKSLPGLDAGGDFGYNLSDNFPGPATSGTYKVTANFLTQKFSVTPQ
ncbi:SusE domain-containing protein [Limnovirga soli]|uniref:SusE outer membrane protein domain-containing protein n=1 Tax=Limnovirga soli TaxID=2656915 RepID=A0A8J8FH05_9BACT|nr:SusE domain-containing protein [Limnovirga soli]NNV56189.1 hypothetical protein [Limnovirga soli]